MNVNQGLTVLLAGAFAIVLVTVFALLQSSASFGRSFSGAATFEISQETNPPVVSIQSIVAGTPSGGQLPVTFNYVVNDASSISTCELRVSGSTLATQSSVQKSTGLTFQSSHPPGSYTGEIRCTDNFGNAGAQSFSMTISEEDVSGTQQAPVCGNNIKESGEECDGTDIDSQSCMSYGYDSGTIGCSSDCTFDTGGCTTTSAQVTEQEQPEVSRQAAPQADTAGLVPVFTIQDSSSQRFSFFGAALAIFLASVAAAVGLLVWKRPKALHAAGADVQQHTQQLASYVSYAIASGMTREQVWQELAQKGWSTEMIADVMKRAGY